MSNQSKLIIANWKMNGSLLKVTDDLEVYKDKLKNINNKVIFALPSLFIEKAIGVLTNTDLLIASQDLSQFDGFGAYTGELSGAMIKDLGVTFSIIGHSERREYFNEDNEILIKKLNNAISNSITPIFCIGEKEEARKNNKYLEYLLSQLKVLDELSITKPINLIIAYEPIWSIGSGKLPSHFEIEEVASFINTHFNNNSKFTIKILYGGSVSNNNAMDIMRINLIDGVLVGGASLKINDFLNICNYN